MALFKTEPSELDWLQVYDMTHWWKIVLRTGAILHMHMRNVILETDMLNYIVGPET